MSFESSPCARCPGCCSFRAIRITYLPIGEQRLDEVLEGPVGAHLDQTLLADGTAPDMDWYVGTEPAESGAPEMRALLFDCHHRGADGRCGVYEQRPAMCRSFRCEAQEGTRELDDMLRYMPPAQSYADLAKVTETIRARAAEALRARAPIPEHARRDGTLPPRAPGEGTPVPAVPIPRLDR